MGLKDVLAKMKLVEVEAPRPRPAATGADLDELLASTPRPRAVDPSRLDEPAGRGEIPDFAAIYSAAGLSDPAHGFTAFKVLEILSAPEFAALAPKAKAAALAGFLKMNPAGAVPIADVIQDAVRRDQALDQFEEFLRSRLAERAGRLDAENAALQAEIDELARRHRQTIAANREALDRETRRLDEWLEAKRVEERRLADAVAPFVEDPPISIGPVGS